MKLRLYPILPGLYQSAKTHDLSLLEKQELVKQYKINIVVNLWHTADAELMSLLTKGKHWEVDCGYIHRYMGDGKDMSGIAELERIADILTPRIAAGAVVLSHCYGGRNRSGLLNAMIVMRRLQCDGNIAYEYIRQRRPNSLVNETFASWLKQQKQVIP